MSIELNNPQFVCIDGQRIAYHRRGSGPSVVLIHGIPTSSYLWRNIIPPLVDDGLQVIAVDLLGYGDSDKPSNIDLGVASQAQRVAAALRELAWNGGAIVGHDIGGGVAQLICANDPQAAQGLVLLDSIAYDSFPEPGIARLKEPVWDSILGAEDFDLRKGLTKGFTKGMVHQERVTPELIAAYERPFYGIEGRLAYLRAARALRTEEMSTRMTEIEKLAVSTLILWGAEDVFQPLSYGLKLANRMKQARFVKIDHAGHFIPEDEPSLVARLIGDFVKSKRGTSR